MPKYNYVWELSTEGMEFADSATAVKEGHRFVALLQDRAATVREIKGRLVSIQRAEDGVSVYPQKKE